MRITQGPPIKQPRGDGLLTAAVVLVGAIAFGLIAWGLIEGGHL